MKDRVDKLEVKLEAGLKEQDDKRHAQNNINHELMDRALVVATSAEKISLANSSQIAVITSRLDSSDKRSEKMEQVIENNTKVSTSLVVGFAEMTATFKTSLRIAIIVVPILSSLVAYIINLLTK